MVCDGPIIQQHCVSHRDEITAVAFNPSVKQLASGSKDNSLVIWNFHKTHRSYRFQVHTLPVTDVCFSPKGNIVASSSCDRYIRLYVPSVTGATGGFRAHSSAVRSVHFSPSGEHITTASDDKTVKLWIANKKSYRFLLSMNGHTNWVRCARFSGDGKMIVSCSEDKTIRLWDSRNGQPIHTISEISGHGNHVEFHPSGNFIGSGMSNSVVKLYDIRNYKIVQYYQTHTGSVNRISFHPNGKYMITASNDSSTKVLDLREGRLIYTISVHDGAVTAVAFSSDGSYFASGGADKQVFVWKTNLDKDVELDKSMKSKKSVASSSEEKDTITDLDMPKAMDAQCAKVQQIYSPCEFEEKTEQGGGDNNSNTYAQSVKSSLSSVTQRRANSEMKNLQTSHGTRDVCTHDTRLVCNEKIGMENENCKCHLNTIVIESLMTEISNIKELLSSLETRVSAVERACFKSDPARSKEMQQKRDEESDE